MAGERGESASNNNQSYNFSASGGGGLEAAETSNYAKKMTCTAEELDEIRGIFRLYDTDMSGAVDQQVSGNCRRRLVVFPACCTA